MPSENTSKLDRNDQTPHDLRSSPLADSRRQLEAVCNNATVALFIMDERQQCVYLNPAAEKLTGYTLQEVQGRALHDVIHHTRPDGTPYLLSECPIDQALPQNNQEQGEEVFVHKDGRFYHVAYTASPIREAGRPIGTIIEVLDITATKRSQEALWESQERVRLATAAAGMGVWMWDPAADRFVWENDRMYELIGVSRADEPVNAARFVTEFLHPEEAPAFQRAISAALDGGLPLHFEGRCRRTDGELRWIEFTGRVRASNGSPLRVLGTAADITDRKRVEAELRASEERLRFLDELGEATRAATDPEAVMAITTRLLGQHLRTTRCAYADVEADNDRFVIRHDWTAGGAPSSVGSYSLDQFGARAADAMRSGRTFVVHDLDWELAAGDGADMFNAIRVKAIVCCPLVKEGRLVAMLAVHQDHPREWTPAEVSLIEEVGERSWAHIERSSAVTALREADRRKDAFLAMLAHELRNPLGATRNAVEVLRNAESGSPAFQRALEVARRQIQHQSRIVEDLLNLSRLSHGKLELRRELLDLGTVARNIVQDFRREAEGRDLRLSLVLPSHGVPVEGDETRLAQVVGNLLHNACKFTPAGGQVSVEVGVDHPGEDGRYSRLPWAKQARCRQRGEPAPLAYVRVCDSGEGMNAEMVSRLFEPFAQADTSLDRSRGGLGLGLALVKELVELHGGEVHGDSPGLRRGAEFTFHLPLAADPVAPAEIPPQKPADYGAHRVLIIEDNHDAADTLRDLLELAGYRTEVAYNGGAGVERAKRFRPHVVLCDIGLPGMDGYAVAHELRRLPEGARLRLIALTGYGQPEDLRRAEHAGFDLHFTKPIEPEELQRSVKRLMENPEL